MLRDGSTTWPSRSPDFKDYFYEDFKIFALPHLPRDEIELKNSIADASMDIAPDMLHHAWQQTGCRKGCVLHCSLQPRCRPNTDLFTNIIFGFHEMCKATDQKPQFRNEQDRQYTYNVTVRRVVATTVAVEKQ
jgi:hypothetical protein